MTYGYDLDGRQTAAGSQTFAWAQPDRLASTTLGNTTTTYAYDGDGLRISAATGSQANKTTLYDWDPNAGLANLVAERNGNGALIRRYRQGMSTVSMDTGGSPFYYHYDGLGSVVNLTGSTGVTQWTYDYLPYGGVQTETKNKNQAPDNVLRFTGQVLDPTGLYQLRARTYDPGTGRFVSTDPAAAGPADPYVSAYVYGNANPIRYSDPSGRCIGPLVIVCIGVAVGVGSYVVSTVAGNAVSNVVNDTPSTEDLGHGLNLGDAIISGTVGALTGPVGGIAYAPTRILATAAYGCAATFASQAVGGRTDNLGETGVGCVFGAVAGIPKIASPILSGLYGLLVATTQSIANLASSGFGDNSPTGGK